MIGTDDRRHGSRAGYLAGCRQNCCTEPNFRYQKRSRLRLQREGTQIIDARPVLERVEWWHARGVSLTAITRAAGIGDGTLRDLAAGVRDVCLKGTATAVLSLTWDSPPDHALCGADLTRARIFSMMAAGHPLAWICDQAGDRLPISGRWRQQERVSLATARTIQRVYEIAPLAGDSRATAVKARNKGHRHPLAWDDPGVPAMPFGWTPDAPAERRGAGRPEVAPDNVEDFDWLVSHGVHPEVAAERVGVAYETIRDQRRRLERKAS